MSQNAGKIIKSILAADAGVTAITSVITPLNLPQEFDYPAITYQRVSTTGTENNSDESSLFQSRMQINCYAEDYTQAAGLANAVQSALSFKRKGSVGSTSYSSISYIGTTDSYNDGAKNDGVVMIILEFYVNHE